MISTTKAVTNVRNMEYLQLVLIYFIEYSCGNSISDDCRSEYDNAIRNGNIDYFYHRCATEGGSQPLRTRCSLCCNNNGNDENFGVGIVRSCADQNDNIHDCESSGTFAESCVCGSNLCNDVCDGCDSDEFKCYQCSAKDSWCYNIEEVQSHGENAKKICSSKKCLISGKKRCNIRNCYYSQGRLQHFFF